MGRLSETDVFCSIWSYNSVGKDEPCAKRRRCCLRRYKWEQTPRCSLQRHLSEFPWGTQICVIKSIGGLLSIRKQPQAMSDVGVFSNTHCPSWDKGYIHTTSTSSLVCLNLKTFSTVCYNHWCLLCKVFQQLGFHKIINTVWKQPTLFLLWTLQGSALMWMGRKRHWERMTKILKLVLLLALSNDKVWFKDLSHPAVKCAGVRIQRFMPSAIAEHCQ